MAFWTIWLQCHEITGRVNVSVSVGVSFIFGAKHKTLRGKLASFVRKRLTAC